MGRVWHTSVVAVSDWPEGRVDGLLLESEMPCENCGHTLQNIGHRSEEVRIFWCPRCGSLKTEDSSVALPRTESPRWTRPIKQDDHEPISERQVMLALLYLLIHSDSRLAINLFGRAEAFLMERSGDAREAVDKATAAGW